MDLESERKTDITINDLTWIHRHKTGALLKVGYVSHPNCSDESCQIKHDNNKPPHCNENSNGTVLQ